MIPAPLNDSILLTGSAEKKTRRGRRLLSSRKTPKGTNPKIRVKDATGAEWAVKWGSEVNAETFATRVAWAAGYFVEAAYFVRQGKVEGVTGLDRAKSQVKPDGSFVDARFERRTKGVKTLEGEQSWSWVAGPFVGNKRAQWSQGCAHAALELG